MKRKLKLFVWTGFNPDYSDGLAFAIAHDVEEARNLILASRGDFGIPEWGDLQVLPLNEKVAFHVSGGS